MMNNYSALSDQMLVDEIRRLRGVIQALELAQPRLKENLKHSRHTMEKALEAFCLADDAVPSLLKVSYSIYHADKALLKENQANLKDYTARRQELSDVLAERVHSQREARV